MAQQATTEIKRRNIYLSEDDDRRAEWIAERTDGGNVSRLMRRLLKAESERLDNLARMSHLQHEAAR